MERDQPSYGPPVDQLLRLGDPRQRNELVPERWGDYGALGVNRTHVEALIRVLTDERLHSASSDDEVVWGPLHAWRALAQLAAVEAVEPLLDVARFLDERDDDWYLEEFPDVFAMIGPPAIVPLAEYLADGTNSKFSRIMAADALGRLGERHTDRRDDVIGHINAVLAKFEENDEELNAFLVSYLLRLRAVESAELIERAYAAGRVDEGVVGRWDDVRAELGVPGLGLVTKDSPRNPNSMTALIESFRASNISHSYADVIRRQRRERRRRKRRRRR